MVSSPHGCALSFWIFHDKQKLWMNENLGIFQANVVHHCGFQILLRSILWILDISAWAGIWNCEHWNLALLFSSNSLPLQIQFSSVLPFSRLLSFVFLLGVLRSSLYDMAKVLLLLLWFLNTSSHHFEAPWFPIWRKNRRRNSLIMFSPWELIKTWEGCRCSHKTVPTSQLNPWKNTRAVICQRIKNWYLISSINTSFPPAEMTEKKTKS